MNRVDFIQPDPEQWIEKFRFRMPVKIRFGEVDMLGHLNNVNYFAYFEQGRIDYLEHVGVLPELFDLKKGRAIVTANLECHFLKQIFYGQPLSLRVRTARLGQSSFDLEYALVLDEQEQLAAAGRGTMVLMGQTEQKSIPIPSSVKDKIIRFESFQVISE